MATGAHTLPESHPGVGDLYSCAQLTAIDRVHKPSPEQFLDEYVRKCRPVILSGVADDWPCMTRWTMEYLAPKMGKVQVQKSTQSGMNHFTKMFYVPFEEFADSLSTTKDLYLSVDPIMTKGGTTPENSGLKALAPDIVFPPYLRREEIVDVNLWMGPGGNKTVMHYDPWHSLLLVAKGSKRFAAFHPAETPKLYPYSVWNFVASWTHRVVDSQIDSENVHPKHADRVREAKGFEGVINEGEMLFLPAGTWHYVESRGLNVAINFFWESQEGVEGKKTPLREYWIKTRIIKSPIKAWNQFKRLGKWMLRR